MMNQYVAPASPSVRPGCKKRLSCLLLVFAVPFFVLVFATAAVRVSWTIRESMGRSAMENRLEKMQSNGVPIDDASTAAEYIHRSSNKHTNRWVEVLNRLESSEFKQTTKGVFAWDPELENSEFYADGDWPHEVASRNFVSRYSDVIAEVVELASHRESVLFPIQFDSWKTLLPYTQAIRNASRLMWLDGLLAIRDGDSKRIARATQTILGNAVVNSSEPFIISKLVGVAQVNMAVDLVKLAIENRRLKQTDLDVLLLEFLELSKIDSAWQSAMRGERAVSLPYFLEPERAFPSNSVKSNITIPPRGWDCILYLDLMDKAEQLDVSNIDSLLEAGKQMDAELNEVLKGGWLRRADSLCTGLVSPAFGAYAQALVRKLVRCRQAAIAIKIEIVRQSTSRLPTDLNQLDLPLLDLLPPGGEAFGYRLDDESNGTLYSPSAMDELPEIAQDNAKNDWRFPK